MPGTGTVLAINTPLTPLALTTAEDTYTITLGRNYTADSPLSLRMISDSAAHLVSLTPGGPYMLNPTTWPSCYNFTGKQNDQIVLYLKATTGTPTAYLCPVDKDAD